MSSHVQDLLLREIASLPDELARMALEFVRFLKNEREEQEHLWQEVEQAERHRAAHPEEVMTTTADEFMALTERPDEKP